MDESERGKMVKSEMSTIQGGFKQSEFWGRIWIEIHVCLTRYIVAAHVDKGSSASEAPRTLSGSRGLSPTLNLVRRS